MNRLLLWSGESDGDLRGQSRLNWGATFFKKKKSNFHMYHVLSLVVHSTLMVARRGTKGMMIQAFVRRCGL